MYLATEIYIEDFGGYGCHSNWKLLTPEGFNALNELWCTFSVSRPYQHVHQIPHVYFQCSDFSWMMPSSQN